MNRMSLLGAATFWYFPTWICSLCRDICSNSSVREEPLLKQVWVSGGFQFSFFLCDKVDWFQVRSLSQLGPELSKAITEPAKFCHNTRSPNSAPEPSEFRENSQSLTSEVFLAKIFCQTEPLFCAHAGTHLGDSANTKSKHHWYEWIHHHWDDTSGFTLKPWTGLFRNPSDPSKRQVSTWWSVFDFFRI